mmetsp:Transcript_36355/g.55818  ORF Transcript_36355/g.55818 Transcript_36355/m.55818 type:complete len:207 (+) Transcript_36355:60-680(+)
MRSSSFSCCSFLRTCSKASCFFRSSARISCLSCSLRAAYLLFSWFSEVSRRRFYSLRMDSSTLNLALFVNCSHSCFSKASCSLNSTLRRWRSSCAWRSFSISWRFASVNLTSRFSSSCSSVRSLFVWFTRIRSSSSTRFFSSASLNFMFSSIRYCCFSRFAFMCSRAVLLAVSTFSFLSYSSSVILRRELASSIKFLRASFSSSSR